MKPGGIMRVEHPLAKGAVVHEAELWDFPEGLIGVPDLHKFAFVPIANADPFLLMCSADNPAFALVVAPPGALLSDYALELSAQDLQALGSFDAADAKILATVILPAAGDRPPQLNLRGPIILAPRTRRGVQRVSHEESHGTIELFGGASAGASCSS
jgi:flagellar assembly factor FliW